MDSDPTHWTKNTTPKSFFNPLNHNIEVDYRDEKNLVNKIIIPSLEISTHPTYLANVLIKHLIDTMINDRELGYMSPEELKKLEEEILV